MDLIKIAFEVNTRISVPDLFAGEGFEFYRNDVGYNFVYNCGPIPLSNDLSEFWKKRIYVESKIAAFSILHNRKFIVKSYKALISDGRIQDWVEFGKTYSAEHLVEGNELVGYDGKVFLDKTKYTQDFAKFSNQIEKLFNSNYTLRYVINRYSLAIDDYDNEFFYLYEIREAIKTYFKELRKEYLEELGLTKKFEREFGEITNHLPFFQSRHRGAHAGKHVYPGGETILKVRAMARELILKYQAYLTAEMNPTAAP